jgi:hypothetical protein
VPSTTTRSPALRPLSMIRGCRSMGRARRRARRRCRRGRRRQTNCRPRRLLDRPLPGMAGALSRVNPMSLTCTELPRHEQAIRLWKSARNSWVPVTASSDGATGIDRGSRQLRSVEAARPRPSGLPGWIGLRASGPDARASSCWAGGRKLTYTGSSTSMVVAGRTDRSRPPTSGFVRPTRPPISARTTASSRFFFASARSPSASSRSARALSHPAARPRSVRAAARASRVAARSGVGPGRSDTRPRAGPDRCDRAPGPAWPSAPSVNGRASITHVSSRAPRPGDRAAPRR